MATRTRTNGPAPALRPGRTILLALAFAFLVSALATAAAQPETYELPGEQVFPEGIAVSEDGSTFYVGSTTSGTIFRGDVQSGEVTTLAEGAAPTAVGMEVDPHGRLWVAGGMTGDVFVYDTQSGDLLRTYETPEADATFLNDLTYTDGSVYVTDSMRPQLFRIGAGEELGELESFLSFEGTPFPYDANFNANGIVVSPDGSALVIVHSGSGQLFRVDLETQEVTQVENAAQPVTNGDGLYLEGNTLYVVRNQNEEIARLTISDSGDSVESAGDPITSERFQFPTTAAVANGSLLVVNSQFDQQGQGGDPQLPFTVARVPLP